MRRRSGRWREFWLTLLIVIGTPIAHADQLRVAIPVNEPGAERFEAPPALIEPLLHGTLLDRDGALRLAQQLRATPDGKEARFTLTSATFTNGAPITERDALFSLERCDRAVHVAQVVDDGQKWIVLRGATLSQVRDLLESCPIVSREAARIAGDRFGTGTLVIGAGAYRLRTTEPRLELVARGEEGPRRVSFVPYHEPALAAELLRRGRVEAVVGTSGGELDEIAKDETFSVSRCQMNEVFHRKDVVVPCRRIPFRRGEDDLR